MRFHPVNFSLRRGRRRARPGAIRICRATTRTSTEQGTPFERPAEFEGRTLDEIKGDELTQLVKERADEVLLNSPFTGGDPVAGNFGGAPAFYDRFEANRGSRPWLVVDPPDGKIPQMSPEGQKASASRAAARAAKRKGRGPADS